MLNASALIVRSSSPGPTVVFCDVVSMFCCQGLLLILFIACVLAGQNNPQTVEWSSKSYGPDGPWLAVTVSIGSPPQTVDLLLGGS
jgi:hypothetical protein